MKKILPSIALLLIMANSSFALVRQRNITSSVPQSTVPVTIEQIEPTPLFPKVEGGQPLKQRAMLHLNNRREAFSASVRITLGNSVSNMAVLNKIVSGKSSVPILITDISEPTPLTVELLETNSTVVLAQHQVIWQPQKKWKIYCASYSHQDLGFGDYPHRLRTSIRHENIRLPLRFCKETDSLPDDDKYRFNIETSEPITSFISFNGKDAANELGKRIREGRISLGGLHNTANTEELSHELMARLFYMSGRHAVDLLGVAPNKTIQNDDVIGLTWPLATYGADADLSYFFHGYNGIGHCMVPAESEPVFFWQGPDERGRLLMRSTPYGGYAGDSPGDGSETYILKCINQFGANWPYDDLLLQEGTDFQLATRNVANQIHTWNTKWAYPRMISSTMDMYFNAIAKQADLTNIKTFTKDANNAWSDQDYATASTTGKGRLLSELLPATEKLAAMAQTFAGGGDQWINLFQGYHRLLQYFEHTNSKDNPRGNMCWYETELEENREMVTEAGDYQDRVFKSATQRLNQVISRTGEKNLIVFNPLPYSRTDLVRTNIPTNLTPVDPANGQKIPSQQLPDGSTVFLATDVPATGYKTYQMVNRGPSKAAISGSVLENRFYLIRFDPATGSLTSLFDKKIGVELVEKGAPHPFNGYLYEFRTLTQGVTYNSVWNRMEKADSVIVKHGLVADVLNVYGKAVGVKSLTQTIILYHDLPRIDFGISMDKLPFDGSYVTQHEAVYVALPLAIPDFTIHHELPGAVIEPYRQQFEGSTTAHYAIRSFTDLSNSKYGVTISPMEGSLICYGEPTSSPIVYSHEDNFKRDLTYPTTSRLYMYLMNNMFDVNIAADQQGPVSFHWSLQTHAGNWKAGGADRFGRSILQPMIGWHADGRNIATLPSAGSFMNVDNKNVTCSVIKSAEANGRGIILRFNETTGQNTTITVTMPMLKVATARATSLVENDRPEEYKVTGNSFKVFLPKFGVKTVRVTCSGNPLSVSDLQAEAVADMQVNLKWKCDAKGISHFNIYRDTNPDCTPTQLNLIGQSAISQFIDKPQLNMGGWLRSCLNPNTTYYYRIIPVDRFNNPGASDVVAKAITPTSEKLNLAPVAVEGVRPILVSPIHKKFNFVNLLFRTACEPDVTHYEIHRSVKSSFSPGDNTLVGMVNSNDVPVRSGGYGESRIRYVNAEYDHAMFSDTTVEPGVAYYYKIRAVDSVGQKGELSAEVSIRTKERALPEKATPISQSDLVQDLSPECAVDGDIYLPWISARYGGGTKAEPVDVWWQLDFEKNPVTIKGLKIIQDKRIEVSQLIATCFLKMRVDGAWKEVAAIKGDRDGVKGNDVEINLDTPINTNGIRLLFPGNDLPLHGDSTQNGLVRINEVKFLLPDGKEVFKHELFGK